MPDNGVLHGVAAFVTGASSGLGEATARLLRARGALVVGADLRPSENDQIVACDVADEESVRSALEVVGGLGFPLRYVVNCAGIRSSTRVLSEAGPHPLAEFRRVLDVNLVGTFNVTRLAAEMIARTDSDDEGGRGAIVNTASIAAYEGLPGQAAYAASKAAVAGMTITLARDLAEHGIRVNSIAPGVIDSPLLDGLTPDRRRKLSEDVVFPTRLGTPDEFAELAAFLLTARYINGEVVRIDGGLRMARG
ncbi:SDR family oxidoreductase [Cnuibacter sp. UC19_7]|uniref:SDR family oxidoreductase n=1 Tax=Cnuibacter sp. UC19_7 TaxID=3350166 RepID=UPI00366EE132